METEIVIIFFLLLSWFLFSIFCGVWASLKGRSGFGFFFLSLLLTPVLGSIAVVIAKYGPIQVRSNRKIKAKGQDD